jgi:DNA-directed RNA polymerase subunit H (RpoH/RPB5)
MSKQKDVKMHLVEKSRSQIIESVLTNIVKMLTERKLINASNMDKKINELITTQSDDLSYTITLDKYSSNDDKTFAIKIIPQKITAVNKASGISDFLNNFKNSPKIVVVDSINKKAKQYISNNFPKTEIFTEVELMINLVDYVMIPKHEVLTKEEVEAFYKEFNCKKRNMPKMLTSDPVARYYNVDHGDIMRILRPSITSGVAPAYRLVVKGEIK